MSINQISNVAINSSQTTGTPLGEIASALSGASPFAALLAMQAPPQAVTAALEEFDTAAVTAPTGDATDASLLASLFGLAPLVTPVAISNPEATGMDFKQAETEISSFQTNALFSKNPHLTGRPEPNSDIAALTDKPLSTPDLQTANFAAESSDSRPSLALQVASVSVPHSHTPPSTTPSIPQHLDSPEWPAHFAEKLVWLARNDQQTAQININPPQLGPVQISLNLQGDLANVAFSSPHPEVRQAIESSLSQLRDMFASAGIQLGDASVGANLAQRQHNLPFQQPDRPPADLENAILPANNSVASNTMTDAAILRGRGLVDLFA